MTLDETLPESKIDVNLNIDNNISEPNNIVSENIAQEAIRNDLEIKCDDDRFDCTVSAEESTGLRGEGDKDNHCDKSKNEESTKQEDVEEPFQGQLKLEKFVKTGNKNDTEYRYFGEIKITGEDSLIVKDELNVQFYFGLQVWSKQKATNHLSYQIRQGETVGNNWIFLMCCNEPDKSNRCSVVFILMDWFQKNRMQLFKSGSLFLFDMFLHPF
jgi:hypothetical protein